MAEQQRRRTRAREVALQALYQLELCGEEVLEHGLRGFCKQAAKGDTQVFEFAWALVEGCWDKREELDRILSSLLEHWTLERIATIDRCVLRMGAFELLHAPDVPPKVAINEAIDLAKRFSTQQSGTFVNGILDRIYTQQSEAASAAQEA